MLDLFKAWLDIDVFALGDKNYKFPEYSSDYYKTGGLVPGNFRIGNYC